MFELWKLWTLWLRLGKYGICLLTNIYFTRCYCRSRRYFCYPNHLSLFPWERWEQSFSLAHHSILQRVSKSLLRLLSLSGSLTLAKLRHSDTNYSKMSINSTFRKLKYQNIWIDFELKIGLNIEFSNRF